MTDSDNTVNPKVQPVDAKKNLLLHDGNAATISGYLYQFHLWCKRTGYYMHLFKSHAAPMGSGKMALDSVQAVKFITGADSTGVSYDFYEPSPPTPDKVIEVNDQYASGTRKAGYNPLAKMPEEFYGAYIVAPHHVEAEEALLLQALASIFGPADISGKDIEDSEGNGLEYLSKLRARATAADGQSRALVSTTHSKHVDSGIRGEIDELKFTEWLKTYHDNKRCLTENQQKGISDDSEIEMISMVAYKDPSTRLRWEDKTAVARPASFDAACDLLIGILRSRILSEKLDQLSNGQTAAAAEETGKSSGLDAALAKVKKLEAALAKKSGRDPTPGCTPTPTRPGSFATPPPGGSSCTATR
jgi:hypothetical protein